MKLGLFVVTVAACGFSPAAPTDGGGGGSGTTADAPAPITCGDLTCDPHATCVSSTPAMCTCSNGWTGDGLSCTDVDECLSNNGNCPAACENTQGSFTCYAAATCTELAQYVSNVGNAEYTLYLENDPAQPWQAYCAVTANGLVEFLSLTGQNFAQYTAGGSSQGSDVKTTFSKVRFDVSQMKIDISDRTFATSKGSLTHASSGIVVTSMPFAVAMDCKGNNSMAGAANIDLTATHFAIPSSSAFQVEGSSANGHTTMSQTGQTVTLTGGGNCGWNAAAGAPSNPFNNDVDSTNGVILPVAYF
jgi:hypothetical protein